MNHDSPRTRQLVYPRLGRMVDQTTGERADVAAWTVTATKERPWKVRSRNRARNKQARLSRRRNRHA